MTGCKESKDKDGKDGKDKDGDKPFFTPAITDPIFTMNPGAVRKLDLPSKVDFSSNQDHRPLPIPKLVK